MGKKNGRPMKETRIKIRRLSVKGGRTRLAVVGTRRGTSMGILVT